MSEKHPNRGAFCAKIWVYWLNYSAEDCKLKKFYYLCVLLCIVTKQNNNYLIIFNSNAK